jgi:hypothetical protein
MMMLSCIATVTVKFQKVPDCNVVILRKKKMAEMRYRPGNRLDSVSEGQRVTRPKNVP